MLVRVVLNQPLQNYSDVDIILSQRNIDARLSNHWQIRQELREQTC